MITNSYAPRNNLLLRWECSFQFIGWQIDELVVQALQFTGNDRRKDIKQFADVLSDMNTSLKVDL